MGKYQKLLIKILNGTSDGNISFLELRKLLEFCELAIAFKPLSPPPISTPSICDWTKDSQISLRRSRSNQRSIIELILRHNKIGVIILISSDSQRYARNQQKLFIR